MTVQTFHCPNCNAPLQYDDHGSPTVTCPYCNSTVIVPEALRHRADTYVSGRGAPLNSADPLSAITQVGILMAQGKKIEAIKTYQQAFGVGLAEAKNAVEALERGEAIHLTSLQGQMSSPNQYVSARQTTTRSSGRSWGGCLLTLIIIAVVIGALAFFLPLGILIPALPGISGLTGPLDTVLTIGGEEGTGPGFFNDTRWVGVDDAGNIYTADFDGGRVQAFDSEGNIIQQWFTESQAAFFDMAVDRAGTVYVLETPGRIVLYEGLTGQLTGRRGTEDDRFEAITISVEGDLVAVSDEKMVRFNPQGQVKDEVMGLFENLPDRTGSVNIRDIALDGSNNLYLLTVFDGTIYKFNPAGVYQDRIGQKGDGPGDFNSPNSLAIDGRGRIYADDFDGILIFDSSGRHQETVSVGGVAFSMVFDLDGNLYRMDRNGNQIIKYAVLE